MKSNTVEKPEFVTEAHLTYLDKLRKSAITNMFGANVYIQQRFGVTREKANAILLYWMETFSDRHKDV